MIKSGTTNDNEIVFLLLFKLHGLQKRSKTAPNEQFIIKCFI